ncbi:MAG: hypothetical protein B0D92_06335 [Spirochaeta sp. LUC14_002_19_P3]|nr:MAG: hypothetical protein B0D92_06335 [Spirochaeta sp. LUC14_002_19_P3]
MNIIVNGESIDFTLENEKTVGEIIDALGAWLTQAELLTVALHIDGEPPTGDEWKQQLIESVGTIEIHAAELREALIIYIDQAKGNIEVFKEILQDADSDTLKMIIDEYREFCENIPLLTGYSFQSAVLMDEDFNKAKIGLLDNEINQLVNLLEFRYDELVHPERNAEQIAQSLVELAGELDETAILLQTGKDAQAMKAVFRLTELLQRFMRCIVWLKDYNKNDDFNDKIHELLIELEDALKANDTVLVGDLLEYEIKPVLIMLPEKIKSYGDERR